MSFEYKKIRINITPWLLGGYVKLKDELVLSNNNDSFSNLSYSKKLAIALAGCVMNIISGLVCMIISLKIKNHNLWYFGYLSILLGVTNLLPIAPCIDGGYIVYLPLCIKIWGREKGMKIFEKSNKISFFILMVLNILSIPFIIYWIINKGL